MLGRQRRGTTWLVWALFALIVLFFAVALGLQLLDWSIAQRRDFGPLLPAGFGLDVVYPLIGALIVSRQPRNLVGWVMCATGLIMVVANLAGAYALRGLVAAPGSLPGALAMAWLQSWLPFVWFPAMLIALLVLFPNGRPPSVAWWVVIGMAVVGSLQQIATVVLTAHPLTPMNGGQAVLSKTNPTAIGGPAAINLLQALGMSILLALLGAGAALIVRLRRASGEEREQIKWVVYVAALIVAVLLVAGFAMKLHPLVGVIGFTVWSSLFALGIPVAMGFAILKYRLYDIDLIINRSLVFGALAAFITMVYVAIVAGLGALIGARGQPNLILSIVATAIVAFAFQPVRERIERIANRLVYGPRATPYEVLSQFTERVAGSYASEEILPKMAEVLAHGTGAARADVWLRLGDHIAPAAAWPSGDGITRGSMTLAGDQLTAAPAVTRVVPVRHQGELFGALSINKRPGEALTPVEEGLLKDLAAEAGLVLRNVRLTAELQARLTEISEQAAELRASRQRIVATQDAERSRLERNIHDGAQQHLVALTVKLRLAAAQAKKDAQRARQMVRALETETNEALQTLRDLARGIYPPLLREKGLVAALQAQADRMEVPVHIAANGVERYPAETEAAVYFSCLEALQNVAKHAEAAHVELVLEQRHNGLIFSVIDDGKGFEPEHVAGGSGLRNMADRIEALGGSFAIGPGLDGGTAMHGSLPLPMALRRA